MEPVIRSDQQAIRAQVDRIAASPTFQNSERLIRFLRFIAGQALDGREEALKESVIGVEVFDRRPSYDPKLEPIVRIQARRLRAKLDEYYQSAGAGDAIRIEIPKGGYIPQFSVRPPVVPAAADAPTRRSRALILIPAAIALVIVAAVVAYTTSRPSAPAPQLVALTSYVGDEFCPAVSPDGRQLAFSWDHDGNADIYVTSLGSSSSNPIRLTTDPGHDLSPAWSPDGSTIAFYRETRDKGEILTVPAHGGAERKIAEIAPAWQAVPANTMRLPGPSWTPDGRFLAIADRQSPDSAAIVLVSLATGERRRLTTSDGTAFDEFPRISARGDSLAFVRCVGAGNCDVYVQPMSGGDATRLTADRTSISGLTWSPDERSIIFSSSRDKNFRLWRVWIRGRTLEPIDGAGAHVTQPSFAGGVLAFQEVFQNINLWRIDLRASAPARPLIASSRKAHSPSLSPDGTRLAFVSNAPTGDEIWTAHADGRDAEQITQTGGRAGSPRWSPDGQSIAFDSSMDGLSAIYVVAANGGTARRLTRGPGNDAMPSWSHDGRWIYYNSVQAGQGQIWKIAAAGDKTPVQITRQGAHEPFASADGKYVYYLKAHPPYDVWRVPADGGDETPVEGLGGDIRVSRCWAVTDRGIYFISNGSTSRLGLYSFERGTVEWLATIDRPAPDTMPSLTVASDNSAAIYAQIDSRASDIIGLQGFK